MAPKHKSELDAAIAEMRKEFGDRTVSRLGDRSVIEVPSIPTGVLSLDLALGCGGFPRGRISELYGPESGGKTSIALHVAAQAQRLGEDVVYVDAENALDAEWARKIGVDVDGLILVQPDSGEQALDAIERFIKAGVSLVVVDSVEGLVPTAELQGDYGESQMGVKARLMGQACRKQKDIVSKTNSTLIYINQTRDKIGVVYGNPITTPGGKALKFWSSIRMEIRKAKPIKEGERQVGDQVKAKIVKNKVAAPHREAQFDLYYGACPCHAAGADVWGDLLDAALSLGLVEKSGSWFSYGGERLGQGHVAAAQALKENAEFAETIRQEILKVAK